MTEVSPPGWPTDTGRGLLDAMAVESATVFHRLCETTPVAPPITDVIRRTCADTLGVGAWSSIDLDGSGTAVDAATTDMARQFSTDVSAVDDSLRGRFQTACGADTFATVQAIYVADMAPRVRSLLDALGGADPAWDDATPTLVGAAVYWATIEDFLRVVHQLGALDPVLTEVVRLHGARQHNCRLCKSIRSRPALVAGATEAMFDAIDRPADDDGWSAFPDRTRTALALTDAMIWHPAHLPDGLLQHVRRDFQPLEAVELVLDVMRNGANKIAVALAADGANVTDGIEVYEIDRDGVAHYGLTAP